MVLCIEHLEAPEHRRNVSYLHTNSPNAHLIYLVFSALVLIHKLLTERGEATDIVAISFALCKYKLFFRYLQEILGFFFN